MVIEWATHTSTGRVREQNEDAALCVPEEGCGVLCDGMGGHRAGEVASRLAVETFAHACAGGAAAAAAAASSADLPRVPSAVLPLIVATREANGAVFRRSRASEDLRGMGCTIVALRLRDGQASFVNVGDSRLYLLRGGVLRQITEDHTRARMLQKMGIRLAAAEAAQIRGVLMRAIGTLPAVEADYGTGPTAAGDWWLLCSDGLTDELADGEIRSILAASPDARAAAEHCVESAVAAGGRDNVTVVVARVIESPATAGADPLPRPTSCPLPELPGDAGDAE